jgi:hypothetical protein
MDAAPNKTAADPGPLHAPVYSARIECPLCHEAERQILVRPRRTRPLRIEGDLFRWIPVWSGSRPADFGLDLRPLDLGLLACTACGFTESQETYRTFQQGSYPNSRTLVQFLIHKGAVHYEPLKTLAEAVRAGAADPGSRLALHLMAVAVQLLPPPEIRDEQRIGLMAHRLARFYTDRLLYGGPCWDAPDSVSLPATSPLASTLDEPIRRFEGLRGSWPKIPLGYDGALDLASHGYGRAAARGFAGKTPLRRLELDFARLQVVSETRDMEKLRALLMGILTQSRSLLEALRKEASLPASSLEGLDALRKLEDQIQRLRTMERKSSEALQTLASDARGGA